MPLSTLFKNEREEFESLYCLQSIIPIEAQESLLSWVKRHDNRIIEAIKKWADGQKTLDRSGGCVCKYDDGMVDLLAFLETNK